MWVLAVLFQKICRHLQWNTFGGTGIGCEISENMRTVVGDFIFTHGFGKHMYY
jgi:hypothetical protein